ncbi:NAD(P)H-dependent oxidoreductase subunit E [Alkalibacter rhizosphaerae]|uniref:NAD(P)H-dependent oxidoreductase subunit E n=1 Tax=Alkalibacter rhizosphaerae TaxID=2815577 RepID=A0A974XFT0_9FIRM|nr:NAD(P)H-dependent oxidoreductase subunit E [Alkalibacter rhizosphaerae]QSX09047.1 NAD(P)H-dependent oxidoreductase subunit E [Alkalibacter rhizosphaerae]
MSQAVLCEEKVKSPEAQYDLLTEVMDRYNRNEKNLIQILHYAQSIFGFLSSDTQRFIAEKMDLPLSRVSGVVSFYSFFSTMPKGRHTISICLGTACYVRGGKKIIEKLNELLGIDVGETTLDRRFSMEIKRCIGACGLAPAISIDNNVHKRVNPNRIKNILELYE